METAFGTEPRETDEDEDDDAPLSGLQHLNRTSVFRGLLVSEHMSPLEKICV